MPTAFHNGSVRAAPGVEQLARKLGVMKATGAVMAGAAAVSFVITATNYVRGQQTSFYPHRTMSPAWKAQVRRATPRRPPAQRPFPLAHPVSVFLCSLQEEAYKKYQGMNPMGIHAPGRFH
jgi:hypothetical protein